MQIDCYGFEATSQWFKRRSLEPHLIKDDDGVLYISFGCSPHGPIHRIDLAAYDAITLVFPSAAKGRSRDFFVRLVITADESPELVFAAPAGETFSFEDTDEDALNMTFRGQTPLS